MRALCAKGLGDADTSDLTDEERGLFDDLRARLSFKQIVETTLQLALRDDDVRVAVEAVRSLVKLKLDVPGGNWRTPVLLAAAQGGFVVPTEDAKLKCRMAMAQDKQSGVLAESKGCGPLALHELASGEVKDTAALEPFLTAGTSAEQLGALDALGAAKAIALAPKIRPLLASTDFILAAGAASALARMGDKASIPAMRKLASQVPLHEDIAPSVADALTEIDAKEAVPELTYWLGSRNATVRHSAAAALTKLTGVKTQAPEVAAPISSSVPEGGSTLRITTERGDIEIALWRDESPRTAGNLWALAARGYFDGLTFHRIVPDFVAQGGDPRGDGEGGPGYMIRCEIGHRPYVRGTVGMALSGKDTGGSQFFITHTATPHLDGKYTAFGQVTKGMEVVDALLEGDKMLKVTALP